MIAKVLQIKDKSTGEIEILLVNTDITTKESTLAYPLQLGEDKEKDVFSSIPQVGNYCTITSLDDMLYYSTPFYTSKVDLALPDDFKNKEIDNWVKNGESSFFTNYTTGELGYKTPLMELYVLNSDGKEKITLSIQKKALNFEIDLSTTPPKIAINFSSNTTFIEEGTPKQQFHLINGEALKTILETISTHTHPGPTGPTGPSPDLAGYLTQLSSKFYNNQNE